MSITSQDSIIALFNEFVQLRQTGYDRDDAWRRIEPNARNLQQRDVERLFALLRNWEANEGLKYKQVRPASGAGSSSAQNSITQPTPPGLRSQQASSDPTVEPIQPSQAESRLKSLIRPLAQKTGLLSKPKAECPSCGQPNRNGEVVCPNCGQVLVGSHKARKVGGTRPMDAPQTGTSFFGPDSTLVLRLPNCDQPVTLKVGSEEVVIGRVVEGSVMIPDVDLTPFEAEQYGVSRLHASLRRHGDTLVITDLNSMNHTHVNGQLLHSHEVRVLNDGDEIRLGWMPVRVYFQHPV